MINGVRGNATVLAPATLFETWNGEEPDPPKSFVGIATRSSTPIAVFHDKETSYAIAHGGTILLLQAIYGGDQLETQLANLPTDKWKRLAGTYTSDGGEHVLFDAMYSADNYADELALEDIEADVGLPVRITIPAGTYALEEYGMWAPATNTEFALTRLVPAGSESSSASAEEPAKPSAKKASTKPVPPKAAVKKPAKKAAAKPATKPAKKTAKQPAKKAAKKTAKQPAKKAAKKPTKKPAKKTR